MADQKPGLFKRLFGGEVPAGIAADSVPENPGPPEMAPPSAAPAPKQSWLQRLASGLKRSSDQLTGGITAVFTKKRLDQAMLDELEDILIQADFGLDMATTVTEALRRDRFDRDIAPDEVRAVLAAEVEKVLAPVAQSLVIDPGKKPFVILMVGVNGSGKTTTIGKLANRFKNEQRSVLLCAADTFRAAAIEQLEVWGQRTGIEVVRQGSGADPSSVVFNAVQKAKANKVDYVLVDTAGRLQTKENLMLELQKMSRTASKVIPGAPHEVLLVLDANTGQNAVTQVKAFDDALGVTGLALTKLDGTAKGGVIAAIAQARPIPIRFIGVGERIEDLQPFDAREFVEALFS